MTLEREIIESKMEDQLQEITKNNVDMQQQIRDLQLELLESKREKEMERIGMELYDDKQILTEVYQPLKERFIRDGEDYAIAHGLVLDKEREGEKDPEAGWRCFTFGRYGWTGFVWPAGPGQKNQGAGRTIRGGGRD